WKSSYLLGFIQRLHTINVMLLITLLITLVGEYINAKVNRSRPLELRNWEPDNYIRCIFCLDYDDYHDLSIFGCNVAKPLTCFGNSCYMRQHKKNNFFLYTSGCLNFTNDEYEILSERRRAGRVVRGATGRETQLCEVSSIMNTCICNNDDQCNNITSLEPFTELTTSLFENIQFDELSHFRYYLPNDPLLKEIETDDEAMTTNNDEYFFIRVYNNRYLQFPSCSNPLRYCCMILISPFILSLLRFIMN
uniref:Uncharacterized protein n=1 Tax=Parascaris univalens TaxID=6257 RepID=A0A914ZTH5_PARUN